MKIRSALSLSALFLLSACAEAQSTDRRGPPSGERRGPPPEALEACKSLSQGASCEVTTRRGEILAGTCQIPIGNQLACVPEGHSERGQRPPPRESGRGHTEDENTRPNQTARTNNRGRGGPPPRTHVVTQSDGEVKFHAATVDPIADNQLTMIGIGEWRVIRANSIAEHKTGPFPNAGNPNTILEQSVEVRIPANPSIEDVGEPKYVREIGWAINGVKFEPGAGEFFAGSRGWQYEAFSGAVDLGFDEHHAHVQPSGHYHYHGLPTGLLAELKVQSGQHSPIIGWAADGFPIYARYGFKDGKQTVTDMHSSWRLKTGNRPSGNGDPGGTYDGTFTADYTFVEGLGDLDECNGKVTTTPDFPDGTYAYFLTHDWPIVPRCLRGNVESRRGPRPRR